MRTPEPQPALLPARPARRRAGVTSSRPRALVCLAVIAASLATAGCAVPVTHHHTMDQTEAYEPPPPPPPPPPPAPARYGTISRVDEIEQGAEPSGAGVALGAVAGGLVGNRFGAGNGRAATTLLGAVGGAFAGNAIEQNTAASVHSRHYRVWVRFDDGAQRAYDLRDLDGLRAGDRVAVRGNRIDRG